MEEPHRLLQEGERGRGEGSFWHDEKDLYYSWRGNWPSAVAADGSDRSTMEECSQPQQHKEPPPPSQAEQECDSSCVSINVFHKKSQHSNISTNFAVKTGCFICCT